MKTISNKTLARTELVAARDTIYSGCNFKGGIDVLQCRNLIFRDCKAVGGEHAMNLLRCRDIRVEGGTYANLIGAKDDPDDPEGHCIVVNDCDRVNIVGVTASSKKPSGDKISLFNSRSCSVASCHFKGPLAKMAWEVIIDGAHGGENDISDMRLAKGVNVCGGNGHRLDEIVAKIISLSSEFTGGMVTAPILTLCRAGELYIHRPTVTGEKRSECTFKWINEEME